MRFTVEFTNEYNSELPKRKMLQKKAKKNHHTTKSISSPNFSSASRSIISAHRCKGILQVYRQTRQKRFPFEVSQENSAFVRTNRRSVAPLNIDTLLSKYVPEERSWHESNVPFLLLFFFPTFSLGCLYRSGLSEHCRFAARCYLCNWQKWKPPRFVYTFKKHFT